MMIAQTSNRRRRFSWFKLSFVIVSHSSWCFVFDLRSLCRVRIIEWSVQTSKRSSLLSNDLKTIKFSQIELFEFYFTFEDFYSVFNSCTRKRHSAVIEDIIRDVMMIDDDDQRVMRQRVVFLSKRKCFHAFRLSSSILLFLSNFYMLVVIIISCLFRWSYWRYVLEMFIMRIHALFRMLGLWLSIVLHQNLSRRIDVVIVVCLSFVEMSEL
jgi:hypothetical protein